MRVACFNFNGALTQESFETSSNNVIKIGLEMIIRKKKFLKESLDKIFQTCYLYFGIKKELETVGNGKFTILYIKPKWSTLFYARNTFILV